MSIDHYSRNSFQKIEEILNQINGTKKIEEAKEDSESNQSSLEQGEDNLEEEVKATEQKPAVESESDLEKEFAELEEVKESHTPKKPK